MRVNYYTTSLKIVVIMIVIIVRMIIIITTTVIHKVEILSRVTVMLQTGPQHPNSTSDMDSGNSTEQNEPTRPSIDPCVGLRGPAGLWTPGRPSRHPQRPGRMAQGVLATTLRVRWPGIAWLGRIELKGHSASFLFSRVASHARVCEIAMSHLVLSYPLQLTSMAFSMTRAYHRPSRLRHSHRRIAARVHHVSIGAVVGHALVGR